LNPVDVEVSPKGGLHKYYSLRRGEPVEICVKGPDRLKLAMRQVYGPESQVWSTGYRVAAGVKGRSVQILEMVGNPSMARIVQADNGRMLGRENSGYVDIPDGEYTLRIESDSDLVFRLVTRNSPNFLLPGLNAPDPDAAEIYTRGLPPELSLSFWGLGNDQMVDMLESNDPVLIQKAAEKAGRDNIRPKGGLAAASSLKLAAQGADRKSVIDAYKTARGEQSTFFNLTPVGSADRAGHFLFSLPALAEKGEQILAVPENGLSYLLSTMGNSDFYSLKPGAELDYRIPERFSPSFLRLLVMGDTPCELIVDMDGRQVKVQVQGAAELAPDEYSLAPSQAGLALLSKNKSGRMSTLDGPFSLSGKSAQRIDPGYVLIPLPKKVSRVRIISSGSESVPGVALQYRRGRNYTLTQGTALNMLSRLGAVRRFVFFEKALELQTPVVEQSPSLKSLSGADLQNQLVPLARMVLSLKEQFSSGVEKPGHGFSGTTAPQSGRTELAEAEKLMSAGYYVQAVELLSALSRRQSGKIRVQALVALADSLFKLSEDYLAEQILRGMFVYPVDGDMERVAAYRKLLKYYRQQDDKRKILMLQGAYCAFGPNPEKLAELARNLVDQGYYDLGLLACFVLTPEAVPKEHFMRAAIHKNWADMASRYLQYLPPERQSYWAGVLAARNFDYERALKEFSSAGESGRRAAQRLERSLRIRKDLGSRDKAVRLAGVKKWAEWAGRYEGPLTMADAGGLVMKSAGTMRLESVSRGLGYTAYRSGDGGSVELEVLGPVKLEMDVRPVFHGQVSAPLNGWVEVESGLGLQVEPIINNWPTSGLEVLGESGSRVGRSIPVALELGSGIHRVSISSKACDLAVRVRRGEREIRMGVLPPFGPDNVKAAVQGRFISEKWPAPMGWWACLMERSFVFVSPEKVVYDRTFSEAAELLKSQVLLPENMPAGLFTESGEEVRKLSGTGSLASTAVKTDPGSAYYIQLYSCAEPQMLAEPERRLFEAGYDPFVVALLDNERREWFVLQLGGYATREQAFEVQSRIKRDMGIAGMIKQFAPKLMAERIVSVAMASGSRAVPSSRTAKPDLDRINGMAEITPAQVKVKMFELLSLIDDSEFREQAGIYAAELAERHPEMKGLSSLAGFAGGEFSWEPVDHVLASAGIRYLPSREVSTSSSALQIRKALAGLGNPDDLVLYGSGTLLVGLENSGPARIDLELKGLTLPYLKTRPIKVGYSLDDGPEEYVDIMPGRRELHISMDVPGGNHYLRVWIKNRLANQFLRVMVFDKNNASVIDYAKQVKDDTEVPFHVATKGSPVELAVEGPARVRVDRLDRGRVAVEYFSVEPGWQELFLYPAEGQDESLFRAYTRIESAGQNSIVSISPPYEPDYQPVQPPLFVMGDLPASDLVIFDDEFGLGSQEGGTWEAQFSLNRRRDTGEDVDPATDPEQFSQLSAIHRIFAENMESYFKTQALYRIFEHGGPTFGLLEEMSWEPDELPFKVGLSGSFYMQAPESELAGFGGSGGPEWSATMRARISERFDFYDFYHIPAVTVFGRALSMESNNGRYSGKELDQDVYTKYKADHKTGITLGDTLYYKPWLDNLWYAGAGVSSNEDFNLFSPDRMSFRTGVRQLVGPVQLEGGYRFTHYFQDSDRSNDIDRDFLQGAVFYDHWFEDQSRFRVGFDTNYDLKNSQFSGAFTFSWFFSAGRGLNDFRPGESDFRSLRNNMIPGEMNDSVR
jgi:hypothetical protein